MPFNLFDDPFAVQQQAAVDPRADESFLGNLMESSLGGLSLLGKLADKTFGGRALRGVLGGNANELFSVLPFSDTLGLTDERNTVHGRQLTDSFGLTTPGDQSWENDVLEFGTEVALDPGTWVGAAVPKLVGRGLGTVGRAGGAGLEALTGGRFNPFTLGERMIESAKAPVRALFDDTVSGAWIPQDQRLAADIFTPELRAGGYRAEMAAASDNVDLARLLEANPAADPNMVRTAMTQAAEGLAPDAAMSLQGLGYGPQQTADLLDLGIGLGDRVRATRLAEEAENLTSKNLLDMSDWQLDANSQVASQNAYIKAQNAAAAKAGLPAPPLMAEAPLPYDSATQYVPRSANVFGEPPAYARRQGAGLGGASEFQMGREDILRGIPGGTAKINEWSMSPDLTGMNRLLPDTDVTQRIVGDILGMPIANIPLEHPAYKQAASIADMLKQLPDEALDRGLFNMDLVGNVKHRELDSVRNIASAKTAMGAVGRGFAKPIKDIMAEGQRAVSLPDFLDSMRLSATDANGFKAAHLEAAKMLGIDPADFEKFKDYGLPMDVAKDLGRIGKAWSAPDGLAPVIQTWDNAVNWFKRNLTVPFPGFHVRNLMSGIFNMWRDGDGVAGAINGPAGDAMMGLIRGREVPAEIAAKLYPNLDPKAASDAILKELVGGKLAFTRSGQSAERVNQGVGRGIMAEDLPKTFQSQPRSLKEDIGDFAGTFKPKAGERAYNPLNTETFVPTKAGEKVGNAVEDWIRGTHYISKRLAGEAPEKAMESVLKYQIDYCVDEATEAMTDSGWKGIDELKVGDRVLTLNPESRMIEWQGVEEMNVFQSSGSLTHWKNATFDAMTTGAHRWLATGSGVRGGNHAKKAAQHFVTTGEIVSGNKYKVLIVGGGVASHLPAEPAWSDQFVELMGWYVTEGWPDNTPGKTGIQVSQSERHNPHFCHKIRLLKQYFESHGTCTEYEPKDNGWGPIVVWRFGLGVGNLIREQAPGKCPSMAFIKSLTEPQLRLLLRAITDGDGNQGGGLNLSQKKPQLAEMFQYACAMLGIRSGLRAYADRHRVVAYQSDVVYADQFDCEPVEYTGRVWCPTTANGTWMARRGGVTYWTGNSRGTEFEKNVMKRLAPWYSYSKGNLPPLLKDLAEKPAKLLGTTRAVTGTREPGEFVPPWVAEGAATPLPGAPDGQKRFISSFGLPIEDELVKTIGAAAHGDADRVFQQLFGMSIPWAKLPAEIATGTQMYSGRKLEDLKPYSFLDSIMPENQARQATQVIANTPASRLASTADKFLDERKGTGLTLLNALTGARVTDVEIEKVKAAAAMQLLKDELRGQPGVKVRENVSVPKDQREKMNLDDLMKLDMLMEIEKRSAERARAAKQQR